MFPFMGSNDQIKRLNHWHNHWPLVDCVEHELLLYYCVNEKHLTAACFEVNCLYISHSLRPPPASHTTQPPSLKEQVHYIKNKVDWGEPSTTTVVTNIASTFCQDYCTAKATGKVAT